MGINRPRNWTFRHAARARPSVPLMAPVRLTFMAAVLAACAPAAPPAAEATPDATELRLDQLEQRLRDARVRLNVLELAQDRYQSVALDPTASAYLRVDAPDGFGSFAYKVTDIRPFGDGVRVTLNLGNLSTAGFPGVTLTLKYGSRMPDRGADDFADQYDAWHGRLKTKEQTLVTELRPGAWNPVEVTLPGISPAAFGYLELAVATDQISLERR